MITLFQIYRLIYVSLFYFILKLKIKTALTIAAKTAIIQLNENPLSIKIPNAGGSGAVLNTNSVLK